MQLALPVTEPLVPRLMMPVSKLRLAQVDSVRAALKSMSCQNKSNIMDSFKAIHLSPVVISKRYDIKHLKNLYEHIWFESKSRDGRNLQFTLISAFWEYRSCADLYGEWNRI